MALVTVVRAGGTGGTVAVNFATGSGTAIPGVEYTPVSGTLVFNPGDTAKTFAIPIIFNPSSASNKTVPITLSNPIGGASLGTPASATLIIVPPGGSSQVGPAITDLHVILSPQGVTGITLNFSEPLDPTRAGNIGNYGYFVTWAGPDGFFGTQDDVPIPITSASYVPGSTSVTLTFATAVPLNTFALLDVDRFTGAGLGLTDTSGNLLLGSDGVSGDPYIASFGAGTRFLYSDGVGNIVTVRLTQGGVLELRRAADGDAEQLRLLNTVAGRSILDGHIAPAPGGPGFTVIPVLDGTQGVHNRLLRDIVVLQNNPSPAGPAGAFSASHRTGRAVRGHVTRHH